MKINEDSILEFKNAFNKDTGISLDDKRVGICLENLVNFFDLLWQYDCEDRQKEEQMEVKQNGKRI